VPKHAELPHLGEGLFSSDFCGYAKWLMRNMAVFLLAIYLNHFMKRQILTS
jgi:hypothetical protein